MSRRPALAILALLVGAAVILIAVELGNGAASYGSAKLRGPCKPRPSFAAGGIDGTIQQIILDGLDGAACRLGTSREKLVLALAPGSTVRPRNWDRKTAERAIRAGLLRAVDRAEQRGDLPSFLAPLVRQVVEHAPIDKLIEGGIRVSDLFGG
jgi:hypothetical protein